MNKACRVRHGGHTFIPSTGDTKADYVCECEASLVHIVNYRSYGERPYVKRKKANKRAKRTNMYLYFFYEL